MLTPRPINGRNARECPVVVCDCARLMPVGVMSNSQLSSSAIGKPASVVTTMRSYQASGFSNPGNPSSTLPENWKIANAPAR